MSYISDMVWFETLNVNIEVIYAALEGLIWFSKSLLLGLKLAVILLQSLYLSLLFRDLIL